jgi:uncharacterized protein Yka (UPF0111/DUF47 family)
LPRDDRFYDYLEGQADTARRAARALQGLKEGRPLQELQNVVQGLEHEGDKLCHEVEEALARTFVTPIDREDLQRLSSELDDILDLTNAAVRVATLYGVTAPTEPMLKLVDVLGSATEVLVGCIARLRRHAYAEILDDTKAVRALEKEADAVFRKAVSLLFQDERVDAKRLLRERAVLDDLENAVDRCEHVARTLANLAVKHG